VGVGSDYLEKSAANSSSAPSSHFSNGLASDKATELGAEATVVAHGEGPVASDDGNRIRSSSRCAALERGDARGADSFGRHEPNQPLAALADCAGAFALDMCKEGVLLGAIELPETEIVLVNGGHFSVALPALAQKPSASQPHPLQARFAPESRFWLKRCGGVTGVTAPAWLLCA
jgi:hypothetical protein